MNYYKKSSTLFLLIHLYTFLLKHPHPGLLVQDIHLISACPCSSNSRRRKMPRKILNELLYYVLCTNCLRSRASAALQQQCALITVYFPDECESTASKLWGFFRANVKSRAQWNTRSFCTARHSRQKAQEHSQQSGAGASWVRFSVLRHFRAGVRALLFGSTEHGDDLQSAPALSTTSA